MGKNRSRKGMKSRNENTKELRKAIQDRELLTFSFRYFDQSQPTKNPQTITKWQADNLLKPFIIRLIELSKLTRDEAINQQQIKIYGDFPPMDKTSYFHPKHIDQNVPWGVIEGISGKVPVAGFISESTFYIVFLDSEHQFYQSTLKHT